MCAKPVRPGTSFFDPTWYQMSTATVGVEWLGARMTSSPFGSEYRSNAIWMASRGAGRRPLLCPDAGADATADAIARMATAARLMRVKLMADCERGKGKGYQYTSASSAPSVHLRNQIIRVRQ